VHFTPEEYRALAEQAGFRVRRLSREDKAWDFGSRDGFVAFARATFVAWTNRLPESQWEAFINDVLDRYQSVAATGQADLNTFKFYQLEVELVAGS
jgi:trans-aconitate 2-methyltransferase